MDKIVEIKGITQGSDNIFFLGSIIMTVEKNTKEDICKALMKIQNLINSEEPFHYVDETRFITIRKKDFAFLEFAVVDQPGDKAS